MFSCFHVPCRFVLWLEVAAISGLYWLPSYGVYSSWSCYMYLGFSLTLYLYTWHTLLAPFCGRNRRLLWLLWFLKLTLLATGNHFLFPGGGSTTQVCAFSVIYRSWCVFLRALSLLNWLFLPHLGAQRTGGPVGGVGLVLQVFGVPHSQWRYPWLRISQRLVNILPA